MSRSAGPVAVCMGAVSITRSREDFLGGHDSRLPDRYPHRMDPPRHLHLDRQNGLSVQWADGHTSVFPIAHLRRWSPCAEARQLRQALAENPLAVLPAAPTATGPLEATNIERVGTYAIRISFSDGHHTGLYSWQWLQSIDPDAMRAGSS